MHCYAMHWYRLPFMFQAKYAHACTRQVIIRKSLLLDNNPHWCLCKMKIIPSHLIALSRSLLLFFVRMICFQDNCRLKCENHSENKFFHLNFKKSSLLCNEPLFSKVFTWKYGWTPLTCDRRYTLSSNSVWWLWFFFFVYRACLFHILVMSFFLILDVHHG